MKKNFWKYFTITMLLLLGLICVAVLYLFFVPGANLFGLTYISKKDDVSSLAYDIEKYNIQTVELNSRSFEVRVVAAESNSVSVLVHNSSFGFTVKKHSELNIEEDFFGNALTFNIVEPYGAVATGGSYIELRLPQNEEFIFDLVLTNKEAQTKIDLSEQSVKNLAYTTDSGNCQFISGALTGELVLDLGRSTFSVAEGVNLGDVSVALSTTSGCFDCYSTIKNLNVIQSNSGVVKLKECGRLRFDNAKAGGSITAEKVDDAMITGGDTNLNFTSLGHGNIDIKNSGKVDVGEITTTSTEIITNSGSISIGKTSVLELFLTSTSGDITVNNAYSLIKADTDSGKINITFADDAPDYVPSSGVGEPTGARSVNSTISGNGEIRAVGLENATITLKGKGSATLYMENVFGKSNIDGGDGNVYIEIKELDKNDPSGKGENGWAHYLLVTDTKSPYAGSLSVNTYEIDSQASGGYTDHGHKETRINNKNQAADVYTKNILSATIGSGSLKIRDSLTYKY